MSGLDTVIVVVPARDEEQLVERCLRALIEATRTARLTLGADVPAVSLVLVADSCTDRTAEIAAAIPGVQVLEVSESNVGAARAAGVRFALDSLAVGSPAVDSLDRIWIANTDADSIVPPNWILAQIELAESGIDLMLGTVRPEFADLSTAQIRIWTETHIPGHPSGNVHGANLGMRASGYLDAGGFLPHAEHEDVDLVRRLRERDARWVTTDSCEVITSGRRVGRTPGGYAAFLAHQDITVAHTRSVADAARAALADRPPFGEFSTAQPR